MEVKDNKLPICSTIGYVQDKKYVLDYLLSRNVEDEYYLNLIKNNDFGKLQNNTFVVEGLEYTLDCFCSCSTNSGNDIVGVNNNLAEDLDNSDEIIIAGINGDDVVIMNTKTNEILLWLIETGEYEKIHVANSLKEFVNMIKYV